MKRNQKLKKRIYRCTYRVRSVRQFIILPRMLCKSIRQGWRTRDSCRGARYMNEVDIWNIYGMYATEVKEGRHTTMSLECVLPVFASFLKFLLRNVGSDRN
jgi:hypothetical protein